MKSNKVRVVKNIVSSILVVLIFLLSFTTLINLTFNLLYIETNVRGFSMQPTINMNLKDQNEKGDKIYINPYSTCVINDIVVAQVDWYEHYIIKRVVGTPGDKVEIKDETTHYAVYVNDNLLYTKEKHGTNSTFLKTGTNGYYGYYQNFLTNPNFEQWVETKNGSTYIRLKENDYFLMGDNWGHTTDSVTKGPVKTNQILGNVELIVDMEDKSPFTSFKFFLKKLFS